MGLFLPNDGRAFPARVIPVLQCSSFPRRCIMKVVCACGHEDHIEWPLDDTSTVHISCTNACQRARQLKVELAVKPLSDKLSSSFPNVTLGLPHVGMLGH